MILPVNEVAACAVMMVFVSGSLCRLLAAWPAGFRWASSVCPETFQERLLVPSPPRAAASPLPSRRQLFWRSMQVLGAGVGNNLGG